MYLMPKQLSPVLFAGTAGIFFAVVNAVKLVPYYDQSDLVTNSIRTVRNALLFGLVLVSIVAFLFHHMPWR